LAGECYVRSFYHIYDFPVVIVRPFNTYGPRSHHEGDSGEVIPKFMLRALGSRPMISFGNGDRSRDFTYVSDTAKGILLAGCHEDALGETFNLGTGREITIQNLAREVARVAGNPEAAVIEESPRPGDVFRHCSDNSKARRLLGYQPAVTLQEGLTRLKDWYLGLGKPIEELLEGEVLLNWKKKEMEEEIDRK
jgi:UDP-glucose 4-epimerase